MARPEQETGLPAFFGGRLVRFIVRVPYKAALVDKTKAVKRCLEEQKQCLEYLSGSGDDKAGAGSGLQDWIVEQLLIEEEKDHEEKLPSARLFTSKRPQKESAQLAQASSRSG